MAGPTGGGDGGAGPGSTSGRSGEGGLSSCCDGGRSKGAGENVDDVCAWALDPGGVGLVYSFEPQFFAYDVAGEQRGDSSGLVSLLP